MKRISLLLLTLLAAVASQAALLWKVTAPGCDKSSYILGSHHLAPASTLDAYPMLDSILTASEMMVCELSADEMNNPALASYLQTRMMAPADSTLSKVLNPTTYATLDSLLQHYGLGSAAAYEPMNPMAVGTVIEVFTLMKEMPELMTSVGVDKSMMALATAAGKNVTGLETVERQAEILYGMPISEQAAALEKLLSSPSEITGKSREMYDLYSAGDIDGLYALTHSSMTPEEERRLLTDRNSHWVNFLLTLLPTSSVMIVVGAGHLGGPQGLLQLLRDNKYEVTPISPNAL
ncbi:MAG: TraB/GumN family protein [Paramuribaculum sp.]|nr:TraB/GumN family protein [Paramuribaculum sp.]